MTVPVTRLITVLLRTSQAVSRSEFKSKTRVLSQCSFEKFNTTKIGVKGATIQWFPMPFQLLYSFITVECKKHLNILVGHSNLQAPSNILFYILFVFSCLLRCWCIFSCFLWVVSTRSDCLEKLVYLKWPVVCSAELQTTHAFSYNFMSMCFVYFHKQTEATTCDIDYAGSLPPPSCASGNIILYYWF